MGEEVCDGELCPLGLLDARQLAVALHEVEQCVAAAVDDGSPLLSSIEGEGIGERLADGDDGRQGVHNLVGQHADELLPGLHLLLLHQHRHVLQRHDEPSPSVDAQQYGGEGAAVHHLFVLGDGREDVGRQIPRPLP